MAEAGWYPDPNGGAAQRYFDGEVWTAHVAGSPDPGVAGAAWPCSPAPPMYPTTAPYGGAPSYGYPPPVSVAAKSPAVSLLISFFLPGVGSMVNGDVGRGVFILIGYLVSCVLIVLLIGLVLVPAFWVWGLVDAYQGARRWNARHGILS